MGATARHTLRGREEGTTGRAAKTVAGGLSQGLSHAPRHPCKCRCQLLAGSHSIKSLQCSGRVRVSGPPRLRWDSHQAPQIQWIPCSVSQPAKGISQGSQGNNATRQAEGSTARAGTRAQAGSARKRSYQPPP